MAIQFAILGLLSCRPATGYDLKKIFEDSSFLYWSGNNNQIYRALLDMQEQGYVTNRVIHQDGTPSKKVYTVTQEGINALKEWVRSTPQPPECKKQFLVQLAWADLLNEGELDKLIGQYQQAVTMQLVMEREKRKRHRHSPNRNERETLIFDMIHQNIESGYRTELEWIEELRQSLLEI